MQTKYGPHNHSQWQASPKKFKYGKPRLGPVKKKHPVYIHKKH